MKKANFKKVQMTISKSGHGHYKISAIYNGKRIWAFFSDSSIYDWIDDDSDKLKHCAAKKTAYMKIREEFLKIYK